MGGICLEQELWAHSRLAPVSHGMMGAEDFGNIRDRILWISRLQNVWSCLQFSLGITRPWKAKIPQKFLLELDSDGFQLR